MPPELERKYQCEIAVNMEDRHTEDYKPAARSVQSFSGAGQRLGSVVPADAGAAAPAPASAPTPSTGAAPAIDASQPTVKVRVQCAGGGRVVVTLNATHTVADLRAHMDATKPVAGGYRFMTTFPNKVIEDEAQTLEAAGLKGGSVVQKPQ